MKLFLVALAAFLMATNAYCEKAVTNYFAIELPEGLYFETDQETTLLAFSEAGPNSLPFMSIEFGKDVDLVRLRTSLESELSPHGGTLSPRECGDGCESYYLELELDKSDMRINRYHYLAKNKDIGFIISYASKGSLEEGRKVVESVGSQILRGSI